MRGELLIPFPLATPDGSVHELSGRRRNEIRTRFATERPDLSKIGETEIESRIAEFLPDAAGFTGKSPKMYTLKKGAGPSEVSYIVRKSVQEGKGIVPFGAKTSLTGASVPHGDILVNMQELTEMWDIETDASGNHFITVEPGVTYKSLNGKLRPKGFFLPCAPTYDKATVGGGVSTNNGGALNYKYGKIENYVEEIEMVLSTGEIMNVKKGEVLAKKGESFEIISPDGSRREAPVPTYTLPDVPKKSSGYNNDTDSEGNVDLIKMIVGSEGTLGIITKMKLRVLPEPPTVLGVVVCNDDNQMYDLMDKLREQQPEKRVTKEPGGISAVEAIGSKARQLVADHGETKPYGESGNALVFFQMEIPDDDEQTVQLFYQNLRAAGINPNDESRIIGLDHKDFVLHREGPPQTVNAIMRALEIRKVGTDACVDPKNLRELSRRYEDALDAAGIESAEWLHGEGNSHRNAMPRTEGEAEIARTILREVTIQAIDDFGGVFSAEHAIGEHPDKQAGLRAIVYDEGIKEMRTFKMAFDPTYTMGRGNIFPVAA